LLLVNSTSRYQYQRGIGYEDYGIIDRYWREW
jgi:hypothetical protein